MGKPEINARIEELRSRVSAQVVDLASINRSWIMHEMIDLYHHARAERQLSVARGCLELLAREVPGGMFIERHEVTHVNELDDLSLPQMLTLAGVGRWVDDPPALIPAPEPAEDDPGTMDEGAPKAA